MQRSIALSVAACLVSTGLQGCGDKKDKKKDPTPDPEPTPPVKLNEVTVLSLNLGKDITSGTFLNPVDNKEIQYFKKCHDGHEKNTDGKSPEWDCLRNASAIYYNATEKKMAFDMVALQGVQLQYQKSWWAASKESRFEAILPMVADRTKFPAVDKLKATPIAGFPGNKEPKKMIVDNGKEWIAITTPGDDKSDVNVGSVSIVSKDIFDTEPQVATFGGISIADKNKPSPAAPILIMVGESKKFGGKTVFVNMTNGDKFQKEKKDPKTEVADLSKILGETFNHDAFTNWAKGIKDVKKIIIAGSFWADADDTKKVKVFDMEASVLKNEVKTCCKSRQEPVAAGKPYTYSQGSWDHVVTMGFKKTSYMPEVVKPEVNHAENQAVAAKIEF